jgi:hypothetical protein
MVVRRLVPSSHADRVRSLALLLDAAYEARATERVQQCRRGISSVELADLRTITLHAMEAYADAVESLAWPVPRGVLQEIRLHRALLGVRHPRRR